MQSSSLSLRPMTESDFPFVQKLNPNVKTKALKLLLNCLDYQGITALWSGSPVGYVLFDTHTPEYQVILRELRCLPHDHQNRIEQKLLQRFLHYCSGDPSLELVVLTRGEQLNLHLLLKKEGFRATALTDREDTYLFSNKTAVLT